MRLRPRARRFGARVASICLALAAPMACGGSDGSSFEAAGGSAGSSHAGAAGSDAHAGAGGSAGSSHAGAAGGAGHGGTNGGAGHGGTNGDAGHGGTNGGAGHGGTNGGAGHGGGDAGTGTGGTGGTNAHGGAGGGPSAGSGQAGDGSAGEGGSAGAETAGGGAAGTSDGGASGGGFGGDSGTGGTSGAAGTGGGDGGTAGAPRCGDGVVDPGEACDLGVDNGPGVGCEATCEFSCDKAADACADADACNGVEACADAVVDGQTVQRCAPAANAAKCTACATGFCDGSGVCAAGTCGDGCIDDAAGEQCDPPNGTTCTATCKLLCGNGTIDPGEECDDGNAKRLDGCDPSCRYELDLRMTSLVIETDGAPAFCTPAANQFGRAWTNLGVVTLSVVLGDSFTAGQFNALIGIVGLDDLTGAANATGLTITSVSASLDPAKGAWPKNAPIDWWFLAAAGELDADEPLALLLGGTLTARTLQAGPGTWSLPLAFGASLPASVRLRGAHLVAKLDGTPAPDAPKPPPAKLAAGLKTFQTMTATAVGTGLCGNMTVESLATVPVPQVLAQDCLFCGAGRSHQYTYCGDGQPVSASCNSLLDVLVGGCAEFSCPDALSTPTQPDVAGSDGDVDALTLSVVGSKVPAAAVAGNDDGYSAYFRFAANRAHLTGKK